MFVIEALSPAGWQQRGTAQAEYWALQEAQILCCSDGRIHRILNAESGLVVAVIDPSSCRIPPGQRPQEAEAARS